MRYSKYKTSSEILFKEPLFKASNARSLGMPSRMLAHLCEKKIIDRVSRGIYRVPEAPTGVSLDIEELVLTASTIPRGVICLVSALSYYNLTDQIMREYWIAVPNADKSPKRPHTKIIRMRNITLGREAVKVGRYRVNIFDPERTVVDSFRFLSHEIAIKALRGYLKLSTGKKPDLYKLEKYAKELRVNINPYILALTV